MNQQPDRKYELRLEFNKQQHQGIPNYSAWLEQQIVDLEYRLNMTEYAAQQNYDLWQAAESRAESLLHGGDV